MTRGRFTALSLTLVALAGAAYFGLPRARRWGEKRLRLKLEARASAAFGAPVHIGRARIEFVPPGVRLEAIRAEREGNRGSQAIAATEEVSVHAGLFTLLGTRQGPLTVKMKRPHLALRLAQGRSFSSTDDSGSGPPGPSPLAAVAAGSTLEINGGQVEIDFLGGPALKLEGVQLQAHPEDGGKIRGRASFSTGSYDGPGGEWPGLGGELTFVTGGDETRLESVAIRGDGVALSGSVLVRAGDAPGLEGSADVSLDVAKARHLFPEGAGPSGQLKASLSGTWSDGKRAATGRLEVENFALWGLAIGTLDSDLVVDEGIHLKGIRAHLLGGEATGTSDVRFEEDRFETTTDLRLDGVDAAQVLDYAGWTGPPLTGTIHYSGQHRIDSSGLKSLRGTGVVDAVGHYRSASGRDLPLEVTVNPAIEGDTINLKNGTLRAGSTRANFSGRWTRSEGFLLKLSGGTGNLSEILPLFAPSKKPVKAPAPGPSAKSSPPPVRPPAPAPPAAKPSPTPSSRPASSRWMLESPYVLKATWPPRGAGVRRAVDRAQPPGGARPPNVTGARRPQAQETETPLERIVRSLGGRWEWDGDLSYGRRGLNFTGRMTGSDLTYQGTPIGSLRARIVYGDDRLAIEEATLQAAPDASVSLRGGIDFRGEGTVSVEGTATAFPLAPVLAVIGMKAPVDGRLNGSVALAGKPAAPSGRARIEVAPVVVAGLEFESLQGDLVFTPDIVEMKPLTLAQGSGRISVAGRIPYRGGAWLPEEGGSMPRIQIEGSGLDLSFWSKAARGTPLEGTAAIEGSVEGSIEAPVGKVSLRASSVKVRGIPVGEVTARADLTGNAVDVAVEAPDSGLTITGRVGLSEGRPLDLKAVLSGTRLRGDTLMSGTPEDIQVTLRGEVTVRGSLADATSLQARAGLSGFDLSVAGVEVAAEAPVDLTLEAGKLRVSPAVLSGPGTRIEVRAEIDPGAAGTIDVAASGRFDLKLLRLFLKNAQATGEGTIILRVGGALADPTYDGRVVVEAKAIRHPDLPCVIDGLLGRAVFEGSRLKIETLEFLAGGGPVTGSGEIQFGDLRRSESPFTLHSATIRFRGTSVKAEFPAGFRSVSDVDLTVRRTAEGTSLSGTFDLVRAVYSKDFKLESFGRPRPGEGLRSPAGSILSGIDLDMAIRAPRDVWLRNDFGNIEMQGELDVSGNTDHPALAGRITAIEGGVLRFRSVEYRVLGGTIDFEDPEMINPIFDLQAETHVGEYQVTLSAEGKLDDFHYELSSNPPLPEQDIVALLITGRTLGGLNPEGGLAEETIGSYLTGLTGEIAGRFKGKAGIDILSVDPLSVNAQGDPTTRITIGKQVTPDLLVSYSNDLGSTQGSVYQLDYALERDFHFTSIRDTDGSIGGDFRYILRGKPPVMPGAAGTEERGPVLSAVKLEGDLRVKEKKVRRRLRLKVGKPRDRAAVNDGIDRVLNYYRDRGYLMADMDDRERSTPEGTIELTFQVRTGPRVKIEIDGARLRAGIIAEIAPLWEKGLFQEDIVDQAREQIETIFKNRGYMQAEVVSEVLHEDAEDLRVRFTVRRGERTQADQVRFAGVKQIPEKTVRKAIRTKPDSLFSRGLVRESVLEEDADAILGLYLAQGFPRVSVPRPDMTLDERGRRAVVTFRVEEGFKASFGHPEFEGNHAYSSEVLAKTAKIRSGDPYVVAELDAAVVRLRRMYDDAGYPDARVTCRILTPAPGEEAVVADPVFDVVEGRPQRVGAIDVAGNVITRDPVIRKALTVEPGESLSRSELQASQTRLYGRGIFRSVSVEPQPPDESAAGPVETAAPAGAAPDEGASAPEAAPADGIVTRDLRVAVREMAPLNQVLGLGYDSDERLRALYEISNRNIFGGGRYVGLQLRASDVQRRGTLSYREKGILGGQYDVLGSAFAEDEERPSFEAQTIGSSIQVSRRFTRATRTLYRYSLKDVNLSNTSADFEGSTVRLSSVAASAFHDTRDAPFDPSRGHSVSGEVQYYGKGIGSEAEFVKMYAQFYRFKTILPKTVWAQALRAGAAVPFGVSKAGSPLTCTEGDIQDSGVPPSERFFAGGDTTVRGFERFRLGDTCNGDPLGGEGLFILNEELRFPIHSSIGGVVFYDGGNVYRTLDDYALSDLRHVAGAGLRLQTPIGPFRVEYGAILNRKPGEDRGQFFFSIGQAF
ncbi:MAG TPA: translocation/assembly module TamB domain-containing protein [Candidatus Polarisedimenticolia bacterium]|nr:translocation/assembly module TamB domain-containing protein [Candidatus Polarisedimenticolia bacterium]